MTSTLLKNYIYQLLNMFFSILALAATLSASFAQWFIEAAGAMMMIWSGNS
jgi:hypothetical protein